MQPTTERNVERRDDLLGKRCPLCEQPATATLALMRFLDPHGVWRVDAELLECSAQRHSFVITEGGIRLLAADGKFQQQRPEFTLAQLA